MLSQPVWDQMLESEKKKVQTLEESYAERMRASNVSSCAMMHGTDIYLPGM